MFCLLVLTVSLDKDGHAVSPFHDIPLWADKSKNVVNMVVEIPKGQQAKLEISKADALNPIKQDVKVQLQMEYTKWLKIWFRTENWDT